MGKENDVLLITAKKREYVQETHYPKISIDKNTYLKLQTAAWKANRPLSQIAKMFIDFAYERTEYVEE